jgi:uncharacterized protein DUF4249
MKPIKITILTLLSLLTLSCEEEEIIWPFDKQIDDLLVVEAVLTNEKIQHTIKLSRPYPEQNITATAVSGATVLIKTNDTPEQIYPATENPIGSGFYLTDNIRAVSGKEYTLIIEYNSKSYYASATQPPVEPLSSLETTIISDTTRALVFNPSGTDANYVKHYLNWQNVTDCASPLQCQAEIIFYDLKNIDVNQQFAPNQEVVEFPVGTVVVRKKYSVSDEYKAYLRGMLSETAWRGGLFDVYPANAPTNLSEGATGFFAVSTILTDTKIIN